MRFAAKDGLAGVSADSDMTPMIDMTFQLIIFLMLMINFAATDQNMDVQLPLSELARPPEKALETPIVLNILQDGQVMLGGHPMREDTLRIALYNEVAAMLAEGKKSSDANVIIRAHGSVPTGKVQEIIQLCQQEKFEKFVLRAQEDIGN